MYTLRRLGVRLETAEMTSHPTGDSPTTSCYWHRTTLQKDDVGSDKDSGKTRGYRYIMTEVAFSHSLPALGTLWVHWLESHGLVVLDSCRYRSQEEVAQGQQPAARDLRLPVLPSSFPRCQGPV